MENIPCKKEIAIIFAIVAQWLEHRSRKAEVEGSTPFGGFEKSNNHKQQIFK